MQKVKNMNLFAIKPRKQKQLAQTKTVEKAARESKIS